MSDFLLHPYPWQLNDWQQLSQLAEARTLPHAMLLAGTKGIGKRHLAEAFAQLLLCTASVEGRSCGKCRGCELNAAQTHPDLFWVTPEEEGKGIKVDQVRELNESLNKTARQGGYKVVIIEPAEAMNANAANALLKSLEEPAQNTIIMLIAHRPNSVIPTIRSRCQLRKMPLPKTEDIIPWLTPLVGKAGDPEQLLIAAGGAPLIALALLDGDKLEERARMLDQWVQLTLGQTSAIDVAATWHTSDLPLLMDWFLTMLHAIARWQVGAESPLIEVAPVEWREQLKSVNSVFLHRYIEKILLAKQQVLSSANPNKQLLVEEILMDWSALMRASVNRAVTAA